MQTTTHAPAHGHAVGPDLAEKMPEPHLTVRTIFCSPIVLARRPWPRLRRRKRHWRRFPLLRCRRRPWWRHGSRSLVFFGSYNVKKIADHVEDGMTAATAIAAAAIVVIRSLVQAGINICIRQNWHIKLLDLRIIACCFRAAEAARNTRSSPAIC